MPKAETLVPYLSDSEKRREPEITVDSREVASASRIVKGLVERGAKVKTTSLLRGDYVISDRCAIERKTVHDFVHTLTRRTLFDQLFGLKETYPNAMVLIEGYLPLVYKFTRTNPSAVWGAMFSLAKQGMALIHTTSSKETIDFLYTAARQEQLVCKRTLTLHPTKKTTTLADAQLYFISSLFNIGRQRSLAILENYLTPIAALTDIDE